MIRTLDKRNLLLFGFVVLAACAVYANALRCEFAYDDLLVILQNDSVREGSVGDILIGDYWGTLAPAARSHGYRPLTVLSFWTQWRLAGESAWSWHAFNVLLHAIVSVFVCITARRLGLDTKTAALAAIFFGIHAVHTEAVTSIVGRAELLATLGVLAALQLHARGRSYVALAPFALGMLAKETALVFPVLAVVEDLARGDWNRRNRLITYAIYAAVAAGFFLLRKAITGHAFPTFQPSLLDNPLAYVGTSDRLWAGLGNVGRYMLLLVAPLRLSADYGYGAFEVPVPIQSPFPWIGLGTIAAATYGLKIALARKNLIAAGSASIFLFAIVPVSNFLFTIHTIFGERLIYLASVGFCIGVAALLSKVCASSHEQPMLRTLALVVVGSVLVGHASRTWVRNRDWNDNVSLFAAAHDVTPGSARVQNNYGNVLLERNDVDGAIRSWRDATMTLPSYPDPWINLANTYARLGRFEEAEAAATQARKAMAAASSDERLPPDRE